MKQPEILIQTDEVRVRVMVLEPGEATALHHHSVITDHMVGLSGKPLVRLQDPEEALPLPPGTRCRVLPGRVHQVANDSATEPASYLLIQGVGHYDFNTVEIPE